MNCYQTIITSPEDYGKELDIFPNSSEELLFVFQYLVIHVHLDDLYPLSFSKQQSKEELL